MEELAMRMSFDDGRDAFYGSFETLTENRDRAVALLALALNKPRFDAEAIERMRAQYLANLAYAAARPDACRRRSVDGAGLCRTIPMAGRPTARPQSVAKIARADLADFQGAHLRQGHAARGGRR